MTAEVVNIRDFRRKEEKQPTPEIPPGGLSLETPVEVLLTIYESSLGHLAPEDEG